MSNINFKSAKIFQYQIIDKKFEIAAHFISEAQNLPNFNVIPPEIPLRALLAIGSNVFLK